MKIDEIVLGGSKKRLPRNSRNHRTVQKDFFSSVPEMELKENNSARIQHIEDLILWSGSKGAMAAVDKLRQVEAQPHSVTIKWDGRPAVIFGRNESGEFVLTDKSGFGAKGYDGRVTSAEELEQMLLARGKKDEPTRSEFPAKMKSIWSKVESVVPADFRGYVLGDLLYFTTPPADDSGKLRFQPNTTEYAVDVNSVVGKQIQDSDVGIVVHKYIDTDGKIANVDVSRFQQGDALIMPPAVVTKAPGVDLPEVDEVENFIKSNASDIDKMFAVPAELKMSNFGDILYQYINASVKSGATGKYNLKHFMNWVDSNPKISGAKKARLAEYLQQHQKGFAATFQIITRLQNVKNAVIKALDNQDADIEAYTDGKRGGEGYVIDKDVKLVNRAGFTAANMARNN